MTISRKFLRFMLVFMVLLGAGSTIYFARENAQRASALEENIEYQVLTAIEAQHPEVYVVAVKMMDGHVLVYYTISDTDQGDEYYRQLAADLVVALYNGYPDAIAYHLLAVRIIGMETFEGYAHVGMANRGIAFTLRAASTLASSDSPADDLDPLARQGEIEFYSAQAVGLHIVTEPTARETGYIPPWAEPED